MKKSASDGEGSDENGFDKENDDHIVNLRCLVVKFVGWVLACNLFGHLFSVLVHLSFSSSFLTFFHSMIFSTILLALIVLAPCLRSRFLSSSSSSSSSF